MNANLARVGAASAALAALILSPLAVETAAKERRVDCRAGRTLDANGQARVFRVGTRRKHTVYACRLRDRFVMTLGENGLDLSFGPDQLVLAGRFVAGDYTDCSSQGCTSYVQVFDVDRGRFLEGEAPLGLPATSLQLTRRGVAAWIRGVDPPLEDQPVSEYRVEVRLDDGTHVLDQGPGIDDRSLARAGSRLYWLKDGRPQTATLVEARAAPLR